MSRGKREMKKPTTNPGYWQQTLIGAMVDLIIGTALILISKIFE